jgi:hypothetical protein
MKHSTQLSDYTVFLKNLDNQGNTYFLERGQAVNFWAEYYSQRSDSENNLSPFRPFTSKDCDIWVDFKTLNFIKTLTQQGSFKKGTSPIDGQLAIYTLDGSPPKTIDLMGSVYGIPIKKNDKLNLRALNYEGIRVLDPLYLFQSKCHCLCNLPQEGRQDKKHLFILLAVVPEYLRELLQHAKEKTITERKYHR